MRKIVLILLSILSVNFISGQNLFQKGNILIQPYYGFRLSEHQLPDVYKRPDVKIKNTNYIGVRGNYFVANKLSFSFQVDYHQMEMTNIDTIYGKYFKDGNTVNFYGGNYLVYYANPNGFCKSKEWRFCSSIHGHVVNKKYFNLVLSAFIGYVNSTYQNSVPQDTIQKINSSKIESGKDYDYYEYRSIPRKAWKFNVGLGISSIIKLTDHLGITVEAGLGYTNLKLGIYYKLK